MPISEATYAHVAMEDPEGQWELVCGQLRSKPPMTIEHSSVIRRLDRHLQRDLDDADFEVSANLSRLRVSAGRFYIPDLCVIRTGVAQRRRRESAGQLEVYDEPMPLVVEVWSPSTGDYDVEEKLREYQRRGDLEIWRIHPYERTLTAWRRQADGGYTESLYRDGAVQPVAVPNVTIELGRLFE